MEKTLFAITTEDARLALLSERPDATEEDVEQFITHCENSIKNGLSSGINWSDLLSDMFTESSLENYPEEFENEKLHDSVKTLLDAQRENCKKAILRNFDNEIFLIDNGIVGEVIDIVNGHLEEIMRKPCDPESVTFCEQYLRTSESFLEVMFLNPGDKFLYERQETTRNFLQSLFKREDLEYYGGR